MKSCRVCNKDKSDKLFQNERICLECFRKIEKSNMVVGSSTGEKKPAGTKKEKKK